MYFRKIKSSNIVVTGERLWDSVTGVSQAGKKKGRAKRAKKVYDLNKGQVIGRGIINI